MRKTITGFVIGVVLGGLAMHFHKKRENEREIWSMAFTQQLFKANSWSRMLRLIDHGEYDTALKLARFELDQSIDRSYRVMVAEEPSIPTAVPNLVHGLGEAEEYLSAIDPEARSTMWLRDVTSYLREESARRRADAG